MTPAAPTTRGFTTRATSTPPPAEEIPPIDRDAVLFGLLAAGGLARLAWLAAGWRRLRALGARAETAPEREYLELLGRFSTSARIGYLDGLRQPVMFGLVRPVILLPAALRGEPADIREAVVAHEIGHVRRRDWLRLALEELVKAVFWFHPAMWWVIARARAAREELVDQLAITMTERREAYLRALLAFADRPPPAPAAPFGDRDHLFQRMLQISREESMSSKRVLFSALVLIAIVAAGGWSATVAFPLKQPVGATAYAQEPGSLERRARLADADHPAPLKIHDVSPLYPSDPEARDFSVKVTIRTTVDEAGTVAETRVMGLAAGRQGTNKFSVAIT